MAWAAYFHGEVLGRIFSRDAAVIAAGAEYLKAYAIDTLLVSFLFCFLGYFNGCGCTTFVMIQGIVGAFCIRIPLAYFFSKAEPVSLFKIGLATPCSTIVQIIMCSVFFTILSRKIARRQDNIPLR